MTDPLPPPDFGDDPWSEHRAAWPKVQRAILMLRLGSLLYFLLTALAYAAVFGVLPIGLITLLPLPFQILILAYLTVCFIGALITDIITVHGLRRRRPWAWVTALVVFAFDASSILLLPMTIIGLKALSDSEVRAAFD